MNRFASIIKNRPLLGGVLLAAALGLTGCQTAQTGNPMPSPNYLDGQVQYFPTGPKFKLEKEAAAMKAYGEQQAQTVRAYGNQQVQAGQEYANQQMQAGYAYADQKMQAGYAYADQQIQQAAGMIPSMSMPPAAQPVENSVTISE